MTDKFENCLAWIIYRECGWRQTPGAPFIRTRDLCIWDDRQLELLQPNGVHRPLPDRPDGMAFDDDPNDTGGRTCMGVIQRVYNSYRQARGEDHRDVWMISDDEIRAIYLRQYWMPLRADELPMAVAVKVFDMGVNAGIGVGARVLQRALGNVAIDSHIGGATIAAAIEAYRVDAVGLLQRIGDERMKYYRQCRTWPHHGNGWTRRNTATLDHAMQLVSHAERASKHIVTLPPPLPAPSATASPSKDAARATPEHKDSMSQSTTGHVAIGTGTGGAATTVQGVARAVEKSPPDAVWWQYMLAIGSEPLFWVGVATIGGAVYMWMERRRLMRIMGV